MRFKEVYSILLEKDFRSKILALGMPQEVADYLHGINDKHSFWFANQIVKMPEYSAARNKEMFVHSLQTQMHGILDWLRGAQNVNLKQFDWTTALAMADEYHKKLTIRNIDRETNKIIKEYPDGFYWVDLESSNDTCEAGAMGHCANTNKGDTLYSLRKYNSVTDSIESFITIAVSPDDGVWWQCKGKRNSKPKKEYYPYIADILVSKNILTFKSEYDPKNDFKSEDLIQYLEENPNAFPNTDEIIEKINEDKVSLDDFQKILDRYNESFKFYDIYISEDDDDDGVYAYYSFRLDIKKSETNLPIECLTLNYRSKGRDAFNRALEFHVSDFQVEGDDEEININGSIEDSDSYFSMDDVGLRSFERQCEYYKSSNEKFDKEEFIEEHLEKILYLDDCIEIKRDAFQERIVNQLGSFYKTDVDSRSLSLTVKLIGGDDVFKFPETVKRFAYGSILEYGRSPSVLLEPKEISNYPEESSYKSADYMSIALFWQTVKRDVLIDYSKHMNIDIRNHYNDLSFPISFSYSFGDDEQTDYDYEYHCLEVLKNKTDEIKRSLKSFYYSVFSKILDGIREFNFSPDNLEFDPLGTDSVQVYTKKPRLYIGIVPKDKLTTQYIKDYAKRNRTGISGDYEPLDVDALKDWLNNNVGSPVLPGFRDFFESRNRK